MSLFKYLDPDRVFQQVFKSSLVKKFTFYSLSLEIEKSFYVYFPKDYQNLNKRFPVVYLLRGHESEWINKNQDTTRKGKNIQNVMDNLISSGAVKPMLLVMPGLSSDDNHIPGLGVNFLAKKLARGKSGIGTGKFEDHFVNDLIPYVDTRFRTLAQKEFRAIDGFSVGGYSAVMLALRHPDLFSSVGSFDGTHMWMDFKDPRNLTKTDNTWINSDMFSPAFNKPFNLEYGLKFNSANLLHSISKTHPDYSHLNFNICCVNQEPNGNRDRCLHLLKHLRKSGFENNLDSHILHPDAEHTWFWADYYSKKSIVQHGNVFDKNGTYN